MFINTFFSFLIQTLQKGIPLNFTLVSEYIVNLLLQKIFFQIVFEISKLTNLKKFKSIDLFFFIACILTTLCLYIYQMIHFNIPNYPKTFIFFNFVLYFFNLLSVIGNIYIGQFVVDLLKFIEFFAYVYPITIIFSSPYSNTEENPKIVHFSEVFSKLVNVFPIFVSICFIKHIYINEKESINSKEGSKQENASLGAVIGSHDAFRYSAALLIIKFILSIIDMVSINYKLGFDFLFIPFLLIIFHYIAQKQAKISYFLLLGYLILWLSVFFLIHNTILIINMNEIK